MMKALSIPIQATSTLTFSVGFQEVASFKKSDYPAIENEMRRDGGSELSAIKKGKFGKANSLLGRARSLVK